MRARVKGEGRHPPKNDEGSHVQAEDGDSDHGSRMLQRLGPAAGAQVRRPGCPAVQGAERGREPPARRLRQLRHRAEVRARAGTQEGRGRSRGEGGAVRDRLEGDQALQPRHRPQGVREGRPEQPEDADRRDAHHRLQAQDQRSTSPPSTRRAPKRRSWWSTTAPARPTRLQDDPRQPDRTRSGSRRSSSSPSPTAAATPRGTSAARNTTT